MLLHSPREGAAPAAQAGRWGPLSATERLKNGTVQTGDLAKDERRRRVINDFIPTPRRMP